MKPFIRLDKAQKKYSGDLLKSICLLDLAGAGYQFISGSHFGVIAMVIIAIVVAFTGTFVVMGTENEHQRH